MSKSFHKSVMLDECIQALNILPDGKYIDATLGEAGHSIQILKQLTTGQLLSIDQDQEAIDFVRNKYPELLNSHKWEIKKGNFENIGKIAQYFSPVEGILMDIGISSRQIDIKGRGFSYKNLEDPLDMRMDLNRAVTAADMLAVLSEKQLTRLFFEYGEERFSGKIAKEIKKNTPKTVGELVSLIYKVVPATARREDSHHPARRVFQALRIAVNDELNALKQGLDEGYKLLKNDGRLVVLTFHSLEDRIVKNFFKSVQGEILVDGQLPSEQEIKLNSRAHSAKLRVIKKI